MGAAAVLVVALAATAPELPLLAAEPASDSEPELIGELTREEIELILPDWVDAERAAEPDVAAAARLPDAMPGAAVTVFLGTWCSDSRRELARLWRALDDAGAELTGLFYIGVDRGKEQPGEWLEGIGLEYVPTIVVRREGQEVGRIVEESPGGIERDLLALLLGESTGLLTANPELLARSAQQEQR